MGFLSDNELLHGDSDDTFGILDDVRPVRLTRVVYSQGEWRFGEEVEALHERTGRMETWYNGSGQPVNARWWQESVRVQPRARLGRGAADLVVTRWPWTVPQCGRRTAGTLEIERTALAGRSGPAAVLVCRTQKTPPEHS